MKNLAPYQLFFPLGLLNALLSVGVWLVQNLGWFQTPAVLIHSKLIAGGFLWSFIVGFLMTAIPRMTGTSTARNWEYLLSIGLLLGLTIFSWMLDARYFYGTQALLILFLVFYGARRVLYTQKPIPVFFSHLVLGMILGLLGTYYHYVGNSYMGIHLFHVGTILLFVLGIGTRFFSFLSGLPSAFENVSSPAPRFLFHGSGVAMAVFLFLAGQGVYFAYLGLTLVSFIYLVVIWRIQRRSDRPSALKYGVRIVAATIPVSFFMIWLQPSLFLTWLHLLFIGCFALITFSVATRVTLAHGAYPVDLEMKSPALWCLVGFLVLGILSRLTYGFVEGPMRVSVLHAAAGFWILAIVSWCWTFLPKIFIPGPQTKPSC